MASGSPAPSGVLLLDKPAGFTSTQALGRARRLLGADKAGHTGTLDPFATGLLPLAFGEATKFSRFLLDATKSYHAVLRLGATTPTGDTESPPQIHGEIPEDLGTIADVLRKFRGEIEQTPPMHSAIRHQGRRLYDLARQGVEVHRSPRLVEIHDLRMLSKIGERLVISVICSKGTYIRTLAMDIGKALGCGAYLVELRRTGVGDFGIDQAVTLETLEGEELEARRARLLPPSVLVKGLPKAELAAEVARRFSHGQAIELGQAVAGDLALFGPGGAFLGVGLVEASGKVAPARLMAPPACTDGPDFA